VLHLWQRGESAAQVSRWLHHESGLLGLSGLSGDMRVLLDAAEKNNDEHARIAVDYFVEHLLRELAGMAAALRGIDTLVFTGGIGEHAAQVRAQVLQGAAWLGLRLDRDANAAGAAVISHDDSAVQVRVMRTNEEAVIAASTARLVAV
jgi:acetate kinase